MHIVALNQYYAPDASATAQLLTELAEGLVGRGHRVTVLASDERASVRIVNGVHVLGIKATRLGKMSLFRRAADYGSFYLGAMQALLRLDVKADVFLPLTTPPLIALAPELVALLQATPVVPLIQDLYPDVAVELGVIARGGSIHRLWSRATALSLKLAKRVIALSEAMAERICRYGIPRDRVEVIPNWALEELEHAHDGGGARARLEYGLGDRFVVMYSGNLGAGHAFETLCEAMKRLRGRRDIVFAIVGDGVRRHEIERFVAREGLDNVKLFPLAPREGLAESLAAADVHVITMRDGLEGLIVPSKLYGILAARRPSVFIGPRTDTVAETLARAEAGHAFGHGEVDAFVGTLESLASDRIATRQMGVRGRAYLEANFARSRALDAYEDVLSRAVGGIEAGIQGLSSSGARAWEGRR